MADSLCGPSNALQNFQKHTSVDRTLQQDRLANRSLPSNGFRSNTTNGVGVLEREFDDFQAGQVGQASHLPHDLTHRGPAAAQGGLPLLAPSFQPEDWASDFQRLEINHLPNATLNKSQSFAKPNAWASSWHDDFIRQAQSGSIQRPEPIPSGANLAFRPYGMSPANLATGFNGNLASQWKGKDQEGLAQMDDAAFEKAFQDVQEEMSANLLMNTDSYTAETIEVASSSPRNASVEGERMSLQSQINESKFSNLESQLNTSSETIDVASPLPLQRAHEVEERTQGRSVDDDELAQTAGELLERVADNSSQKFQDSNFLALMRQLRDHEVRVEGDKVVKVSTSPEPSSLSIPAPCLSSCVLPPPALSNPNHLHLHTPPQADLITCKVFGCDIVSSSS